MVRVPVAGPSRTASSAAGSVAREIQRRRDKPYKTERATVLAKKQRLNINTSYREPPEGYTFLPVGTPDLADLCKKLSKERDLPISVVNEKPISKRAHDPKNLTHHVHRIGYHFYSEVLEQAVADLGYTIFDGRFVKEADLAKKREESAIAKVLLKNGLKLTDIGATENHDQVRAAIKELFPKIPNEDLEGIVEHAWEEGSGRVGSVQTLDLPRRVQLAVIARIRHKYTDYDNLLRAFEWREARTITEPVCLEKLIEWRGEQETEEDDQLEEMVRDIIVIDDDGDDSGTLANGSEADDEDSAVEQGDHRAPSIEIVAHQPYDTDIGGESAFESARGLRRSHAEPRRSQRLQILKQTKAREKIAAARQRRPQNGRGPPVGFPPHGQSQARIPTVDENIERVYVPNGSTGGAFEIDGVRYEPMQQHARPSGMRQYAAPQAAGHQPRYLSPGGHYGGLYPAYAYPTPENRPVLSIEPVQTTGVSSADLERRRALEQFPVHGRPETPDHHQAVKRRRVDMGAQYGQPPSRDVVDLRTPEQPRYKQPNAAIVDLMSPEPFYQPYQPSPLREVRNVQYDGSRNDVTQRYQQYLHTGPPQLPSSSHPEQHAQRRDDLNAEDVAYDPAQPMLHLPQQVDRLSIRPEHNAPSPYHNISNGWPAPPVPPPQQPAPPPAAQYYEVPQQRTYQQYAPPTIAHREAMYQPPVSRQPGFTYSQPPPPPPQVLYQQHQPSRPTPQPIHGAPAPVQVIPRYGVHQGHGRPPTVPPPQPPTDGAPAPVQWIPRPQHHSGYG